MRKLDRLHNRKRSINKRRELRNNLTIAEALLWKNLKNSSLEGKKFRRQHGIGPYIADFYCPECRVIIELDGAGHYNVIASEYDAQRTIYLEKLGMRVIRFENREVTENLEIVLDRIRALLKKNIS